MKRILRIVLAIQLGVLSSLQAQDPASAALTQAEIERHVRFLASDELAGRKAGYPGNNVAARYIAEQFRQYGVKKIPNHESYYQSFYLNEVNPAKSGTIEAGEQTWKHGEEMLVMGGKAFSYDGEAVFVGYGMSEDDYAGKSVEGKVVVARIGMADAADAYAAMRATPQKQALAKEKGAIGFVELYNLPVPWNLLRGYLSGSRMQIAEENTVTLPTFWLNDGSMQTLKKANEGKLTSLKIESSGSQTNKLPTQNVVGYIEGTDEKLKDEYILLTAHFDHVGVGKAGAQNVTAEDTIFNGARDNAIGTTAIIAAAKILAKNPPKRSVVLIALTAEEVGLLGSRYYAENPMMPLEKCVFNLNIDGAGYNNTEIVTVIGLERTGAKSVIEKGTETFDLRPIDDPAPEQGLFDRSDNVNFAAKGIPAPTFSLGFTAFDAEIGKYYHQVTDEAESVDFPYVLKFCQSYVYTAELIANLRRAPRWQKGDKYEPAAKVLYGY